MRDEKSGSSGRREMVEEEDINYYVLEPMSRSQPLELKGDGGRGDDDGNLKVEVEGEAERSMVEF